METKNNILIPFNGIKEGIHNFSIQLDKTFIDEFVKDNTFTKASVQVIVDLHKQHTVSHMEITIQGTVSMPCDRCLAELDYPVYVNETVYIKQGNPDLNQEEDENIVYFNTNESEIDCSQFVYESIILSLPLKVTHDDIDDDNECDEEMLSYYEPSTESEENSGDDIDPRWEQLKKLK